MPQSAPDLPILDLLPRHLLFLLRLEFHLRVILRARIRRARRRGANIRAHVAAAGSAVLEALEADGEVAFVRHAAVGDVPLLGTQRADEFFVVADHDDAAFVVADRDGEAAEGVAVEEIGRLVEHE